MLKATPYKVSITLLEKANNSKIADFRESINRPTGDFFYDDWEVKEKYKNTVWSELISVLPDDIGEARIITLSPQTCYTKHCDVDDRYHLNLHGDEAYLIDLEQLSLSELQKDCIWYEMNAGVLHTAASFGQEQRKQLVVRKLLRRNNLEDPVEVSIFPVGKNPRYLFDNTLSRWLNYANKNGIINNFKGNNDNVKFDIDREFLNDLQKAMPNEFLPSISND